MSSRREPVIAAGAVIWRVTDSSLASSAEKSASAETLASSAEKSASAETPASSAEKSASAGAVEICLVHRPKYDDWSLPKGKLDPGEHLLACAAREVWEETGHRVTLGLPLPVQQYDAAGRAKRVHYWLAEADQTAVPREPDDEVDEVVFLPVAVAIDRLTHERDAQLVRAAARGPIRATPLVVLRHAAAVSRSAWSGPDIERPLDGRGATQAMSLVPVLVALGLRRVISSDSVRCVDTIRPFTERNRIMMELEPLLSEESLRGTGPQPAAEIMRSLLADGPALVCSHRPVLPLLFDAVGADCATLAPGEFVVLHHRGGLVVAMERHRAP